MSVNSIPAVFMLVICRLNMDTANKMVNTCLMFAVQRPSNQFFGKHCDGGVKHTSHSHAQSSCFLVRRETDDVQPEGDAPVHDQTGSAEPGHLMGAPVSNTLQLVADPRVKHALDERQRAHPSQQV